jgi:CubicO group peptidase (beta-lactamase class C family)
MNVFASLTQIMTILFFLASSVLPGHINQAASGYNLSIEKLDTFVEEQMRRNRIPGMALAITYEDQILYLQGYGDAAPNQPVTPQTPFYIGSVSKSFTALAAMQLSEAGRLDLDAPVQDYLPWFRVADEMASSAITVRHLLNQTSGLAVGAQNAGISPDALMETAARNLKDVRPVQPPGTSFHYYNPNYTVLGLLVETVSGQTYADYLFQHIFTPLDMQNSFTSVDRAKHAGLAQGYGQAFGFPIPRQPTVPHIWL